MDATDEMVPAHELGHEFWLTDEYNSFLNDAPNKLDSMYSCDPSSKDCCFKKCDDKSVCCYGNKNDEGGRSIMSYSQQADWLLSGIAWTEYHLTNLANSFLNIFGVNLEAVHPIEQPRKFDPPSWSHLSEQEMLRC